jgi:hypothetical protein
LIPLGLLGVAEWYVNFSTFSAVFIPVFAAAGTIIVGLVFAWASHMHGSYLKQLAEIIHPSVEYRNVLGRKIALVIATILLIIAFSTVVWLRYIAIAEQLRLGTGPVDGTFGGTSTSMVWSKLGPTIVMNLLIWGLGTLWSFGMHERVPELRESYKKLARANKQLDRARRPYLAQQTKIKARYERERQKNQTAIHEYTTHLDQVRGLLQRMNGARPVGGGI